MAYNTTKVSGDLIKSADWNSVITALEDTSTGHDHDGTDSKTIIAANITNVPYGTISSTTVQDAINELSDEISTEDMWDRTGTTISYKTSADTLSIDGPFITSSTMELSANSATITHSGTTSLTIASTSGTVIVEGLTFTGDAVTGASSITSTSFVGDVTGNVSGSSGSCTGNSATSTLASTVTVADESSDTSCFVNFTTADTGSLSIKTGSNLTFNSSTGILTATGFSGALTGDVTGNVSGSSGSCTGNSATATLASTITVADTTSATCYVALWEAATGSLSAYSDAGLTYAADTGTLTATAFSGPLTGNVTGNCSGSSGTCTGNAGSATYASAVTVADESTDTTCYPLFVTANTGNLPTKVGSNLTFNSNTGSLGATIFTDGTFSTLAGAFSGVVSISDGTASWSSNSLSGFTSISGTTLTDGTFSASSGAFTSVASISDGTASWSSNSLSGFTSISGTTITDGTFSASSGAFTSVTSISDGTASWSSNSLSGFTSISGTTVTDGTCSITSGAISGGTTIGCSGNITTSGGNVYATNGSLNTGDSDTAGSIVISDGSSHTITIDAPSIGASYNFTLPTDGGTANYGLITDGSGNLSYLQLLGNRTMVLSAAGAWASTTNGASGATQLELGTNDVDIVTQDFDKDTNEYVQWTVAMPDNWDGSTVTAKFYWSHPAASAYNVIWGLQARAYANDDALDQAWGDAQEVTDSGGTSNDLYISADTSAITVGGSPAAGQLVQFRAYRNAADGSDTLDVDARLHSIKLEYGISSLAN